MYNTFGTFMFPVDPWVKHKKRKDTRWRNSREFYNWFMYLANLYLNTFEWDGFPETVNTRFLEETLFWDGKSLFFDDKYLGLGMLSLPCAGEGNMNVYWEYTKYRAVSNLYNEVYLADECVLIRENQLMYPPLFMIEVWAAKISDASRTIDIYSKSMKRPWLYTGENEDKLTAKILTNEIDSNELVVIGEGRISQNLGKVYQNNQDGNSLMALWRHKHELLDECLTWMGINNANTEKRERLITSEVESNNQLIQLNTDTMLDWRKEACKEINKKFGLNVTVKIKNNYITQQEVDNNGKMDNDIG